DCGGCAKILSAASAEYGRDRAARQARRRGRGQRSQGLRNTGPQKATRQRTDGSAQAAERTAPGDNSSVRQGWSYRRLHRDGGAGLAHDRNARKRDEEIQRRGNRRVFRLDRRLAGSKQRVEHELPAGGRAEGGRREES